jgi:hypothetical protein
MIEDFTKLKHFDSHSVISHLLLVKNQDLTRLCKITISELEEILQL